MTARALDADAAAWLREALVAQAATVRRTRDPACAGDVEALHDLRVALRRTRSLLTTFAPLVAADTEVLRDRLRAEGVGLGRGRDDDVVREVLADLLAAEAAETDVSAVTALLDAPRRPVAAADVGALELPGVPDVAPADAWPLLAGEWRRLRKRVTRAERAHGAARVEAMHRVRKTAKRARYAAESLTPSYPSAEGIADLAHAVQDALGEHRDTVLVRGRLRALAAGHPEHAYVLGRLDHRAEERGDAALARYADLAHEVADRKVRRSPPRAG